jgi:hypothetical protein
MKKFHIFSQRIIICARCVRPQSGLAQLQKEHLWHGHVSCHKYQYVFNTRRTVMAKGQQRKTKEAKKPKKQPVPTKVSGQA